MLLEIGFGLSIQQIVEDVVSDARNAAGVPRRIPNIS